MRRVLALAFVTTLVAMLVAPPAAAGEPAPDSLADDLVLAVEGGGSLGPEPQPRLAEDNKARELAGYENPEVPFTWGAAWILTFTGMVGLVLLAGLYWLLVHNPSKRSAAGA
jgi:hypothetical protein